MPVVLAHVGIFSVGLERDGAHVPKVVHVDGKSEAKRVLDRRPPFRRRRLILQQLPQAPPQGRLHVLEVAQARGLAQEHLVQRQGQGKVQEHAVVDSQPEHQSEEHELLLSFQGARVEPKRAGLWLVDEHAVVGRQELADEELEELLLDAAC